MSDLDIIDTAHVPVVGGPLDGIHARVEAVRLIDFEPVPLLHDVTLEPLSDDPYVMLWHPAYPDADPPSIEGEWKAVFAELLRDELAAARDDRDPEAHESDATLGIRLCEPGKHDMTPWVETRRGNRTRHCVKCGVSQGSVV